MNHLYTRKRDEPRRSEARRKNKMNQDQTQSGFFGGASTPDPGAGKTSITIAADGSVSGRTALGHVSAIAMGFGHVAEVWAKKCPPWTDFFNTVEMQSGHKYDLSVVDNKVRLTPELTLKSSIVDIDGKPLSGVGFTDHGLNTLARSANVGKGTMEDMRNLKELAAKHPDGKVSPEYVEKQTAAIINTALELRNHDWMNPDLTTMKKVRQGLSRDEQGGIIGTVKDREFVLRLRDGDGGTPVVRAVVSEKYTRELDNIGTLNLIANTTALKGRMDECLISHAYNNGDNIRGAILIPDHFATVEGDSDYGIGIEFRNSEVMEYLCEVRPYLFRCQCVNGCVWGRRDAQYFLSKKHLGNLNMAELQLALNGIVDLALSHGQLFLNQMTNASQVQVEHVYKLMMLLASRKQITTVQLKAWIKAWKVEPNETAHGIVNGLTRAAHESFGGNVQQVLEGLGGEILTPSLDCDLDTLARYWSKLEVQAKDEITDEAVDKLLATV